MPSLNLEGSQLKRLNEALSDAFKLSTFDRMLAWHVEKDREEISLGDDKVDIIFEVIDAAERQGWTTELLSGALASNPKNAELRSIALTLGIGASGAAGVDLERVINPGNGFIDFATWSEGLFEIEGQVCRIELGADAAGTGFLVGNDLVLTNRHVVENVISDSSLARALRLRFDYKRTRDKVDVHVGTLFSLDSEWLVDERPHSAADTSVDPDDEPKEAELDYALLRVSTDAEGRSVAGSPVGGKATRGASERGYMKLAEPPPVVSPNQPLVIVQHPSGDPLKLAIDTDAVLKVTDRRIRYKTNTEPGSSGSPVFNGRLQLVALHHAGDPSYAPLRRPEFNQGIPVARIQASIKQRVDVDILK